MPQKIELSSEGVKLFLQRWIDSDYKINSIALYEEDWDVRVIVQGLGPMEAEWLAHAAKEYYKLGELLGIHFEYESDPEYVIVPNDRDSILRINFEYTYKYVMLTNLLVNFIYFKDQSNRYVLLCGEKKFLEECYKCSSETEKMIYFDWVNDDFNNKEEKNFLIDIWNKYKTG